MHSTSRFDIRALGGLLLSISIVSLASISPPATAQAPDERTFVDTVDVRVLEVEVVVTDSDGQPVPNLEDYNFHLLVDGQPVSIDYFAERSESISQSETGREGTNLLVFVDDYFTDRRFRNALMKRLVDELDTLQPGDRMAIVRFAGRGLEVVTDWNASPSALRRDFEHVRQQKTGEMRRRNRMNAIASARSSQEERHRVLINEVGKSTSAVAATLRSFSDAPGRKVLVLISTGWPMVDTTQSAFRRQQRKQIQDVVDTANLLGYTIYPLHLGALTTNQGINAANRTRTNLQSEAINSIWNTELAQLDRLADETGGQLFAYSAVLQQPFERLITDTRSYYSLGFSPTWRQDDRRHQLEVMVAGCEGCEVRHRQHFRDLSASTEASMKAEAALLLGNSGPPLEVTLGKSGRSGLRSSLLPIEIRIPMDWATSLPTNKGHVTQLELRVAAVDNLGDRSEMPVIPITLEGPKPAPGAYAVYETSLKIRRRAQRLVLNLVDQMSGESLTTTLDLDGKQKEEERTSETSR